MPSILLEYRLRIRTFDDSADALVVTSVRGDALPFLAGPPTGDGTSLDHPTGKVQAGVYTGRVVDAITGGTSRVLTSILEDAGGQSQLGYRKGYWEFRENAGAWLTLGAGLVTRVTPASDSEWDVTISEAMALEHQGTSFAPKTGFVTATANAAAGATAISVAALPFFIPSGTTLAFANTKTVTLTADAAAGALALTVSALAQAIVTGDSAVASEPIVNFLSRWPLRGCIFGGPVRGGFLTQPDLGGWQMQINSIDALSGVRALGLRKGYGPPSGQLAMDGASAIPRVHATIDWSTDATQLIPPVNKAAQDFYIGLGGSLITSAYHTIEETRRALGWRGLVVELIDPATGLTVGFFQPQQIARFNGEDVGKDGSYRQIARAAGSSASSSGGLFIRTTLPVSGTQYRVRLFSIEVSDRSPIYWTGHPVDYMAALWAEQDLAWDAAALETVRDAIGRKQRISVRKTATVDMGPELENVCYGPFGIGVRMNDAPGAPVQLQPFVSRIFPSPAPAVVLTDADVVQKTTRLGDLDTSGAIRRVIVTQQRLVRSQDAAANGFDVSDALDGFLVQSESNREENGDPFAISQAEQSYDVPGMIHLDGQQPNLPAFTQQLAGTLFARRGRGTLSGETTAIRGGSGSGLAIGDELLVAVKQLPNKNKRYGDDITVGARRYQVVRLTPQTIGKELKVEDSGPNANAIATVPTLSIAQSADFPRSIAELTVTNAATMNALGLGLRIRIATSPASAPVIPDFADFIAYAPGKIPTAAIRLPETLAGYVVDAIARCEQPGAQPGAYTAAVSVTLAAMNPPTAVSVTPSGTDGSQATVAWTIGASMDDCLIDVSLRAQGDPVSNAVRQQILEPGSTQYVLEHLTPGANYTASVQHRDRVTGDVSALVDVNFTAGGTTITLPTPLYPQWFVGGVLSRLGIAISDGSYGMAVFAAAIPGFVEFFEAVETGVGTGTYGSFTSIGKIASVQGDWTKVTRRAPNDKLRRQMKAQHLRDGATSSGFTAIGTVVPWGPAVRLALPPFTRAVPSADDGQYSMSAATSDGKVATSDVVVQTTNVFGFVETDLVTPGTIERIYRIPFSAFHAQDQTRTFDAGSGYLRPGTVGSSYLGIAPLTLPYGATIVTVVMRAFRNAVGDTATVFLDRASDNTDTTLATLDHATTGWASVSNSSLSEVVGSSFMYILKVALTSSAALTDARLSYVEITVTVPNLNTGL